MKKVLVVYSADMSPNAVGGIQSYLRQLVQHRPDCRFDILTVCQSDVPDDLPVDNVIAFPTRLNAIIPIVVSFLPQAALRLLRGQMRRKEYETVIFNRHEELLLAPFFLKARKVLLVHGSVLYGHMFWSPPVAMANSLLERLLVWLFADSVYVLLNNQTYGVPYYRSRHRHMADRIGFAAVPLGPQFLAMDRKRRMRWKGPGLRLIYFGRLNENPKRIFMLPDLAAALLDLGYDPIVTVAGHGPDKRVLEKRIRDAGLIDRFRFIDVKGREELIREIDRHDASLVLSKYEGICISAIESLARGVPVAAFPVGDLGEYITNMENGVFLVEGAGAQENAQRIVAFLEGYDFKDKYLLALDPYRPENCFANLDI